eukprot:9875291-Alexandrium_andersonii.AAC.1
MENERGLPGRFAVYRCALPPGQGAWCEWLGLMEILAGSAEALSQIGFGVEALSHFGFGRQLGIQRLQLLGGR